MLHCYRLYLCRIKNIMTMMPPKTTKKIPGKSMIKGLGMSADDVFFWANWVLVGALIVGVLSTYSIVVSGNIRDANLKRELAEKDEATAELEKEAAAARLETEKIKSVVAWRTIEPADATKLENALAEKPGKVNLRFMDGDPEALFLAIQFSEILAKSKWQVAPGALKPANAIVFGIGLPDSNGADAQTLRAAFLMAGIAFSSNPVPSGPSFSVSFINGAPMLMIGSRPPPQLP